MIAFFCGAPYQVIIATHLIHTEWKDEKVDLYILDHFAGAKDLSNRLRSLNLFNRVIYCKVLYLLDTFSSFRPKRILQRFDNYTFSCEKIVRSHLSYRGQLYSDVYYSYPDFIIKLALKVFHKYNMDIKIHLFEDGFGGYFPLPRYNRRYNDVFYRLTGVSKLVWRYDSIRVFRPELMYTTEVPIKKIPSINIEDKQYREMLNSVFNYSTSDSIEERIVFFEQPNYNVPTLDDLLKEIISPYLSDDAIVKLHPRTKQPERYRGFNVYKNSGLPWEVIIQNSDIKDNILISSHSTALLTPKLLFNKEPIIVFLYDLPEVKKLFDIERSNPRITGFIKRFKQLYDYPERVLIPSSIQELNDLFISS